MFRLVSFCLSIVAVALTGFAANAQSASTSVSAPLPENPSAAKKFSLIARISASSDLEETKNAEHSQGGSLDIRPSMRISSKSTLAGIFLGEYDSVTGNSKMLNSSIAIARDPIKLTNDDDLKFSGFLVLPTEEDARLKATLRGGAGLTAGIAHRFAILGKASTFSYTASAVKNVHEYTRTNARVANLSHRLRNLVNLDVAMTKKITLSAGGYYQVGQTYDNVVKEIFVADQSVAYALNEQYSVELSHSNDGGVFEANGRDWNAELYDSRNSEIGVSLTGAF
jgi:hypothetical protein